MIGDRSGSVKVKQTAAFIRARSELVALSRKTKVDDGAGGYKWINPTPIPAQKMRMIPTRPVTDQPPLRTTSDGREVTPNWFLVLLPDADIQLHDQASIRGIRLEVVFITTLPEDRIVAECFQTGTYAHPGPA